MKYCERCGKELDDQPCLAHYFCGYGYDIQFCARCCPIDFDGDHCDYDHPKNNTCKKCGHLFYFHAFNFDTGKPICPKRIWGK